MKGYEVISSLKHHIRENEVVVSSNGNISREAYNLLPKNQVYLRGSMGLTIPVGLGIALANPKEKIIVITGDGSFLMGLNSITTVAFYKPANLKILILDNQKYYTTGGQTTVSSIINYSKFLSSLNIEYYNSKKAIQDQIDQDLTKFINSNSLSILHLNIEESKMDLENIPLHPEEITKKVSTRLS